MKRHLLEVGIACVLLVLVSVSFAQTIPTWQPWTAYTAGTLVTFNGTTYKCIQSHTSQPGWEPPNVPALWGLVSGGSPDFSISGTPASQNVTPSGSASYTVSIGSLNGFSGKVSLSASGLPSGATAAFNPSFVSRSGSSTLSIATTNASTTGSFTLAVMGTSGSLTHRVSVTLSVGGTGGSGTTTGTVHFHLLLGVSNAQDSLTLDGGNFNDLIMSNM